MASGIDRFSKDQFEATLFSIDFIKNIAPQGITNGQYTYLLDFGSPHVSIMLFSSIDHSGYARDNAEDSIRAVMARKENDKIVLLPGKVQTYVTRRANWRINLSKMLKQMALLARWIQPCPECDKLLRLSVRRKDKEVFLYCQEDSENRNNPNHERHLPLTVIDFTTGEKLKEITPEPPQENAPTCPKCNSPMLRMSSGKGFRCGKPGNRWQNGKWSLCDGVIWD